MYKTIYYHHVYVLDEATCVGPMEKAGPLGALFDSTYDDLYCNEVSYEKAEQRLVLDACDRLFRKTKINMKEIDLIIAGDLLNQLATSHYVARDFDCSFIGVYAACATSSLMIGQGASWVENYAKNVLCFTSSHNATAEKQFRYPNEYGIQKKETTTFTVTGAGALILSRKKTKIKVESFTAGKIVDWNFKDANDMGKAMAPAAFETITNHLINRKQSFDDYDLILTGDLSKLGFLILCDLFKKENYDISNKLYDCGLLIYDIDKQNVFAGGSGCACSMCVSLSYVFDLLKMNKAKRILVVATGALLSPIVIQQKDSIPCIAHAIEYVRSD